MKFHVSFIGSVLISEFEFRRLMLYIGYKSPISFCKEIAFMCSLEQWTKWDSKYSSNHMKPHQMHLNLKLAFDFEVALKNMSHQ